MKSHGHKKNYKATTTYDAWAHMRQRCNNPKNKDYANYGARKIQICRRWQNFVNFLEDMGNRPTAEHSLDRLDNNKGYSKKIVDGRQKKNKPTTDEIIVWKHTMDLPSVLLCGQKSMDFHIIHSYGD